MRSMSVSVLFYNGGLFIVPVFWLLPGVDSGPVVPVIDPVRRGAEFLPITANALGLLRLLRPRWPSV